MGLTKVQSKVFTALVSGGDLNAKEISRISKVSRPDVYRSLSKLQELGLIEKEITKPFQFRTIPSEIALNILINRRDNKTHELKMKTQVLRNKFNNILKNSGLYEEPFFTLLPSKESLIVKLKKAIQNTKKSIDVLTSSKRFNYACYCFSEQLKEAWSKQIKGRAIIEKTEKRQTETVLKIWEQPWADIHYISVTPSTVMSIYDRKEVFLFTVPSAELKDSPALWSNCPSLINLANKYFEELWDNFSIEILTIN